MKTYQFVTFALIGLIIAGAFLAKGGKKRCSCGDHSTDVPVTEPE